VKGRNLCASCSYIQNMPMIELDAEIDYQGGKIGRKCLRFCATKECEVE